MSNRRTRERSTDTFFYRILGPEIAERFIAEAYQIPKEKTGCCDPPALAGSERNTPTVQTWGSADGRIGATCKDEKTVENKGSDGGKIRLTKSAFQVVSKNPHFDSSTTIETTKEEKSHFDSSTTIETFQALSKTKRRRETRMEAPPKVRTKHIPKAFETPRLKIRKAVWGTDLPPGYGREVIPQKRAPRRAAQAVDGKA